MPDVSSDKALADSGAWLAGVPRMGAVKHVHMVGIGGAGMCGIAELLLAQGYAVSGSDLVRSAATERLAKLGAAVSYQHDESAIDAADVVVATSAVTAANVEVAAATRRGIPVLGRGAMLAELMRYRQGIAIAGAHGKTTVASMTASIFEAAGLAPGFAIGGEVTADGGNAKLGSGPHFIAEADESDASFLHMRPVCGVVTNIDQDHMDTYGQDVERLRGAFVDFANRLPFYGTAIINRDDALAADLIRDIKPRTVTYGFAREAECRAQAVRGIEPGVTSFRAVLGGREDLEVTLPMSGCHNVQNALAAIAVAHVEGIDDDAIVGGLAQYRGVARRFQIAECDIAGKRIALVDDYGHHPTELRRAIAAMRQLWPRRRLVMVFQPHRYSRTRDLFDDFVTALSQVDVLVLSEVYAASEAVIDGADGLSLANAIRRHGTIDAQFAATPAEAMECLLATLADNDVVAIQGAGDIDRLAAKLRKGQ